MKCVKPFNFQQGCVLLLFNLREVALLCWVSLLPPFPLAQVAVLAAWNLENPGASCTMETIAFLSTWLGKWFMLLDSLSGSVHTREQWWIYGGSLRCYSSPPGRQVTFLSSKVRILFVKQFLCPVDLETVGLFIEGFSLSPKLVPFMAVVYTAGASREDLGKGKDSVFSLSMKQWL